MLKFGRSKTATVKGRGMKISRFQIRFSPRWVDCQIERNLNVVRRPYAARYTTPIAITNDAMGASDHHDGVNIRGDHCSCAHFFPDSESLRRYPLAGGTASWIYVDLHREAPVSKGPQRIR